MDEEESVSIGDMQQPGTVRVRIETLMGRTIVMTMPKECNIGTMKKAIENHIGLPAGDNSQVLLRRQRGASKEGYVQLSDEKTVGELGLYEDERLMLIPATRSGPINYLLEESKSDSDKVFVETPDGSVGKFIDELMKKKGTTRQPGYKYILCQMANQKTGEYTIVEIRPPQNQEAKSKKVQSASEMAPKKQPQETEADRLQNMKTRSAMDKLRADMKRKKELKAKQRKSICSVCGIANEVQMCKKCETCFCQAHSRAHGCRKIEFCRQQ